MDEKELEGLKADRREFDEKDIDAVKLEPVQRLAELEDAFNQIQIEREKIDMINATHMHHQIDRLEKQLDEFVKAMFADPDMPVLEEDLDPKILELVRQMKEGLDDLKGRMDVLEEIERKLEMLDDMDETLHQILKDLSGLKGVDFFAMYRNILEQMNVEAIKIYRNLQAVIVEEDAKQNHVLVGVDGKSDKVKKRMNHVMIFSIISFVISILVMLILVLPQLGVDLF